MHFSYLFTAFLATLALASPVANPYPEPISAEEVRNLTSRDNVEETDAYKAASAAAHKHLEKDKYYWFQLTWDLNAPVEGDQETKAELRKLQEKLGFEHVALVVGQILENEVGKGKNKKTKKAFHAMLRHMIKNKQGKTESRTVNFTGPKQGQTLKWGGETTKKKADIGTLNQIGKNYVETHEKYSVDDNHCKDYYDNMLEKVK
ncbi:hypothetical protein F4779DRAFT_597199 [Xylariaceae sp. FL0662B]|nr:hypothetical protein F4779DRAFT_597199 [Xylariaceae sp. FL0662B]